MSGDGEANFEMPAPTPVPAQDANAQPSDEMAVPAATEAIDATQSTNATPAVSEADAPDVIGEPAAAQALESDQEQQTLSEKISQAKSAENAQEITMEHFEHLLRASGCTEEEIKELLGSTEPAVPSMEEAAKPEDEVAQEPANETEEEKNKKTFLEILRKQLKKLGTPEEIEDHLNRLGFNLGQSMGDGFAKFVEQNADVGEFIRYLGTNEYYGKVAHDLGYKNEDELKKEGFSAVGAEEIEAYTGLSTHAELGLMMEGLEAAELCSPEDRQSYLKREPKDVFESVEFKLMVAKLTEGNLYHTKFSERVAFLVSQGDAKARLSDEGFTHMLMIPERGKIEEKSHGPKEETPPTPAAENPPATEPQPNVV